MTDSNVTNINTRQRNYWGVCHKGQVQFSGTYKEAWAWFVKNYAHMYVHDIVENEVEIKRIG